MRVESGLRSGGSGVRSWPGLRVGGGAFVGPRVQVAAAGPAGSRVDVGLFDPHATIAIETAMVAMPTIRMRCRTSNSIAESLAEASTDRCTAAERDAELFHLLDDAARTPRG